MGATRVWNTGGIPVLLIAFVAFVALVLAWLVAPNGEVPEAVPAPTTPPSPLGEPAAA
jgi:ABC-type multidrug transport system permease subunit